MGGFNSIEELKGSEEIRNLIKESINSVYEMQEEYHKNIKEVKSVDVSSEVIGNNVVNSGGGVMIGKGEGINISQNINLETELQTVYYANFLSRTKEPIVSMISLDMVNVDTKDNSEAEMPNYYDPEYVMNMLGFNVESAEFDFDNDRIKYKVNYGGLADTVKTDAIKAYNEANAENADNKLINEKNESKRDYYLDLEEKQKALTLELRKYIFEHPDIEIATDKTVMDYRTKISEMEEELKSEDAKYFPFYKVEDITDDLMERLESEIAEYNKKMDEIVDRDRLEKTPILTELRIKLQQEVDRKNFAKMDEDLAAWRLSKNDLFNKNKEAVLKEKGIDVNAESDAKGDAKDNPLGKASTEARDKNLGKASGDAKGNTPGAIDVGTSVSTPKGNASGNTSNAAQEQTPSISYDEIIYHPHNDPLREPANDAEKEVREIYKLLTDSIATQEDCDKNIHALENQILAVDDSTEYMEVVYDWQSMRDAKIKYKHLLTDYKNATGDEYEYMSFSDLYDMLTSGYVSHLTEKIHNITEEVQNITTNIQRATYNYSQNIISIEGNLEDVNLKQNSTAVQKMIDDFNFLRENIKDMSNNVNTDSSTVTNANTESNGSQNSSETSKQEGNSNTETKQSSGSSWKVVLGVVLAVAAVALFIVVFCIFKFYSGKVKMGLGAVNYATGAMSSAADTAAGMVNQGLEQFKAMSKATSKAFVSSLKEKPKVTRTEVEENLLPEDFDELDPKDKLKIAKAYNLIKDKQKDQQRA